MRGHAALELGDEFPVAAEGEVGVHERLERGLPQFVQACDLALREGITGEVRQSVSAPQPERRAELGGGARGVAGPQRRESGCVPVREPQRVDAVRVQAVARARRDEQPVDGESATHPRDVHLEGVHRRRGGLLAPQRDRQPLCADRLAGMQDEHRQQGPSLGTAERYGFAVTPDLE
jgi:hypothetical protein